MPQLKLNLLRLAQAVIGSDRVYHERLKAMLAIGNSGQIKQDCIVDTGAPLTIFPQRQWERFENDVTWLYIPGSHTGLPDWLTKVTGLGAQPLDCRIGKVKIQVIEWPCSTPPVTSPQIEITAKFPEDNGAYSNILFGIGGAAFENWKLVVDYANSQSWLEY